MAKRDRAAMAKALQDRQDKSSSRRGGWISIFKDDLEDDIKFWPKIPEGDHTIDIIPYIAGANDPDPDVKEGEDQYVLYLHVHQRVGAAEGQYVCLAKNFNLPCPICQHVKVLREEDADKDDIDAVKAKARCVYNIVCYDSDKEEGKGVQIWETSWWQSEKIFTTLAKAKRGRGGKEARSKVYFADSVNGKSITFTREGTGMENTRFYGHALEDRDYEIDDETLDGAHCLDDLITIPTYEELYKAYWGEEPKAEEKVKEEETTTSRRGGRSKASSEEQTPDTSKEEVTDNPCPGGGTFGGDIDKLEHCEECEKEKWKACARANRDTGETSEPPNKEDKKEDPSKEETISRRRRSKEEG